LLILPPIFSLAISQQNDEVVLDRPLAKRTSKVAMDSMNGEIPSAPGSLMPSVTVSKEMSEPADIPDMPFAPFDTMEGEMEATGVMHPKQIQTPISKLKSAGPSINSFSSAMGEKPIGDTVFKPKAMPAMGAEVDHSMPGYSSKHSSLAISNQRPSASAGFEDDNAENVPEMKSQMRGSSFEPSATIEGMDEAVSQTSFDARTRASLIQDASLKASLIGMRLRAIQESHMNVGGEEVTRELEREEASKDMNALITRMNDAGNDSNRNVGQMGDAFPSSHRAVAVRSQQQAISDDSNSAMKPHSSIGINDDDDDEVDAESALNAQQMNSAVGHSVEHMNGGGAGFSMPATSLPKVVMPPEAENIDTTIHKATASLKVSVSIG
jgi:hypothetical protein